MPRLSIRLPAVGLAVVAGALAFAACSDNTTGPRSLASGDASFLVTPNGNSFDISSGSGTQFCPEQTVLGYFSDLPNTQGAGTNCIAARDLEADGSLDAYNPGWAQLVGAHWVGFTVNAGPSSDYRPTPGKYLYQEQFTLPANVTNPSLSMDVRADNVVAVYLNGKQLAKEPMQDCNDGAFGPCFWTVGGTLHVSASAGDFAANPAVNTLSFVVADVPTGYPDLNAPPPETTNKGGPAPQYGCVFRTPQQFGSHGFSGDNAVTTTAGHVGPAPTGPGHPMSPPPTINVPNPTQDGCENPTGLVFKGTVSWTAASTTWCSPGFWKNNGRDLWTSKQSLPYLATLGALGIPGFPAPLGKKAPAGDPTLLQVIDNPSIYGGPATNSVADYLSNLAFGTPIGSGIESCPGPSGTKTL